MVHPPGKEAISKISPKPECEEAGNVKTDTREMGKTVVDKLIKPTAVHEVSISILPRPYPIQLTTFIHRTMGF